MAVKCVVDLCEKAIKQPNRLVVVRRKNKPVYEAEFDRGFLTLIHWGTTILKVHLSTKELIKYGGYSKTDQFALNSVFEGFALPFYCNHNRKEGYITVRKWCISCHKAVDLYRKNRLCDECLEAHAIAEQVV